MKKVFRNLAIAVFTILVGSLLFVVETIILQTLLLLKEEREEIAFQDFFNHHD